MKLHYLLKEPKIKQTTHPVLVLLHGYGSNEEDLFSFAEELPENYYIFSVRAPYNLQPFGYAWYAIHFDANENKFSDDKQAIESRDIIANFIDEITVKYPINKEEVTLIGFSQGAILSYAVALSYPEKIARVVALSGYLNKTIIADDFQQKNHKKLQFYISHGTSDQVIPVDWAKKAPDYLKQFTPNVIYEEYPIGHGVSPQNFYGFKTWLTKTK